MTKPLTQTDATLNGTVTVRGPGQTIVLTKPERVVVVGLQSRQTFFLNKPERVVVVGLQSLVLLSVPRTHLIRICTRASVS